MKEKQENQEKKEQQKNNPPVENIIDEVNDTFSFEEEETTKLSEEEIKINTLEANLKETNEKYLRLLAEMDNTKKRHAKSFDDLKKYSSAPFAKDIIANVDVLKKALSHVDKNIKDESYKNFVEGIKLLQQNLEKTIEKNNIVKIHPMGEKYNPLYHESLYAIKDETKENGTIIEVMEDGYILYDRVLHAAKVGIIQN